MNALDNEERAELRRLLCKLMDHSDMPGSVEYTGATGLVVEVPRAKMATEWVIEEVNEGYPFNAFSNLKRCFVLIEGLPDENGNMVYMWAPGVDRERIKATM